jgi:hypothetical protein
MSLPLFVTIPAFALLVTISYKYLIYPATLSPLAKIPAANFSARFSPFWINYIRFTQQENKTTYDLHMKLGPIVLVGPNELSVNCYEKGVNAIYLGNFPKHKFYLNRFDVNGYGFRHP